jgi:hypothetical protein
MLYFVETFYVRYIQSVPSNKRKPPPENFLHPQQDRTFALFLQRTKSIANSAELVSELKDEDIQRSPFRSNFFWD